MPPTSVVIYVFATTSTNLPRAINAQPQHHYHATQTMANISHVDLTTTQSRTTVGLTTTVVASFGSLEHPSGTPSLPGQGAKHANGSKFAARCPQDVPVGEKAMLGKRGP